MFLNRIRTMLSYEVEQYIRVAGTSLYFQNIADVKKKDNELLTARSFQTAVCIEALEHAQSIIPHPDID